LRSKNIQPPACQGEVRVKMTLKVEKKFEGTVRRARASDADLLTELGKQTFYEAFCEVTAPDDMAAHLKSSFKKRIIENQIKDERSLFVIAEMDSFPAGYAYSYPTTPPDCIKSEAAIQLVRLYLRKQYYGRSVGDALMQTSIDESRGRGYRRIWLSSWELNHRANAFYKRWQFEIAGRQKFTVGSDIQNDFILCRKI
jgi:ribosomal protein S18 acetylase RimI-like enzyme